MNYLKSSSWEKISSCTLSIREFNQFSNDKKIAIFSGYVKNRCEFNYHDRIYQWLKKNGYYVILTMPRNDSLLESDLCRACDVFIERKNFGYDFGSYACGLQYVNSIEDLTLVSRLLFVNDSFIGPFGHDELLDDSGEFWCNTDSNQVRYHYQSYLFGFNLEKVELNVVNDFFFERGNIYTDNKSLVIDNFELSMYEYFYNQGLECNVLHPVSSLKIVFLKQIFSFISFPNFFYKIVFYIRVLLCDVNPTHQLWLQLFSKGFPFIKKELFRDNPTGYPELSQELEKVMHRNHLSEESRRIFEPHK